MLIGGPNWLQEHSPSRLCPNATSWANARTGETVVTAPPTKKENDAAHGANCAPTPPCWHGEGSASWHPSAVAYTPRAIICPSHITTPASFGYTPLRAPVSIASALLHPACVAFQMRRVPQLAVAKESLSRRQDSQKRGEDLSVQGAYTLDGACEADGCRICKGAALEGCPLCWVSLATNRSVQHGMAKSGEGATPACGAAIPQTTIVRRGRGMEGNHVTIYIKSLPAGSITVVCANAKTLTVPYLYFLYRSNTAKTSTNKSRSSVVLLLPTDRGLFYLDENAERESFHTSVEHLLCGALSSVETIALVQVPDLAHPHAEDVMHSFMSQNVLLKQQCCASTRVAHCFAEIKTHRLKNDGVQNALVAYLQ